jgi:hypothetical protein
VFVGGLNYTTTDEALKTYFEQFGEVTDCVVMKYKGSDRSRGFGKFADHEQPDFKTANSEKQARNFFSKQILEKAKFSVFEIESNFIYLQILSRINSPYYFLVRMCFRVALGLFDTVCIQNRYLCRVCSILFLKMLW